MIIQDIKGWTYGFMKRNEHQCVKYIISLEEDATNAIQHENFSRASVLFRDIVGGFEKLSVIDKDNYELPLYTALFCLAKIEAFHLSNKEEAIVFIEKAIEIAKACSAYDREDSDVAEKDLEVLRNLISKLRSCKDVADLISEFGEDAWRLSNDSVFSNIRMDNTISGFGCLMIILVFGIFFVLCSIYPPTRA